MAAARHNLTRRAVLGAAAGMPAFMAANGAAAWPSSRRWNAALVAFRQAQARLACLARETPDELLYDLECFRIDALRRLLGVPAPDLRSLSLKVDLTVDEEVATLTGGATCLAALKADARRLAYGR